ncbi:short chain dehydrogenase [Ilyonectria robusta]
MVGHTVFTTSAPASPQSQVAHNFSKAAFLMLKSTLAAECTRCNISVKGISPGYIDTTRNTGNGLAPVHKVNRNPSGWLEMPEVTGAVVMLLSRSGSYINGPDIVVHGGGIVFEWWVIRLVCLARCNNPTIPVSPIHCYPDFGFGEEQHPRR